MRKFFILATLIGVSQARCPDIGPDAFADILHNQVQSTIFGGIDYQIENRAIPDFAIESTKRPRITVNGSGHRCHYVRKIGNTRFGSFTLIRRHHNDMVIVERERPDIVVLDESPVFLGHGYDEGRHEHHHRHHR